MFDYDLAVALMLGVAVLPIVLFYAVRSHIRKRAIRRVAAAQRLVFPPGMAFFLLLTILLPLVAAIGIIKADSMSLFGTDLVKHYPLVVESDPPGEVRINGVYRGTSPVRVSLVKGAYRIKVDAADGYAAAETLLSVNKESVDKWAAVLKAVPIGSIRAYSSPTRLKESPDAASPTVVATGNVELDLLAVRGDWYLVRTATGEEGWIRREDAEAPVTVTVTSTPPLAKVYVEGSYKGMTPLEIPIKPGTYDFRVGGLADYRESQRKVSVSSGSANTVDFQLTRIPPPRVSQETFEVTVRAKDFTASETDRDIYVKRGDELVFNATGNARTVMWDPDQPGVDPDGAMDTAGTGMDTRQLVLPSSPAGCLIGRIGDSGPWFAIGKSARIKAEVSGNLHLAINDSKAGYGDNYGLFKVTVTKQTVISG